MLDLLHSSCFPMLHSLRGLVFHLVFSSSAFWVLLSRADSSWGRVRMEFGFTLSNWVDITLQITLKQKAYCLTSLDSYCLEVEIHSMDLSLPIKSMQNLVLSQGNMSFLTCSIYALFGLLHILLLFSTWIKSLNCTGALVTQKLQMAKQSQLTFVYFILDRHHFY